MPLCMVLWIMTAEHCGYSRALVRSLEQEVKLRSDCTIQVCRLW